MKSTTLAILAAMLPAQMAFAGDDAKNAMDALESLNGKGYVDLGIEETKDRIVVYGEKKGKRVALTYEKDGFDLVGKRVTKTKVNPKNVASDDAGEARLHEAEEETDAAREELQDLREAGASDKRIDQAERTLHEAEEEEDDIRTILQATDDDRPAKPKAKAKGKAKGKAKAKPSNDAIVERLHEAEEETDDAREELNDLREVGASDKRIDEAEKTLHEAEEEEDDIRAIAKAKAKAKAKSKAKSKEKASKKKAKKPAIEQRLHEAEEETDDAREELNDLREVGASDKRIDEAEKTLHEAEEEEDDIRAIAKK